MVPRTRTAPQGASGARIEGSRRVRHRDAFAPLDLERGGGGRGRAAHTPAGSVGGGAETLFIIVAAAARRDPPIRSALPLQCRRSEERGEVEPGASKDCLFVGFGIAGSVGRLASVMNGSSSFAF
jgi:hypothetical protein